MELPLHGLTVLVGENGTGKSSIIEAAQILREATTTSFFQSFNNIHGGSAALLRKGAERLTIGAEFEGKSAPCTYEITMAGGGYGFGIDREVVHVTPRKHRPSAGDTKLLREGTEASYFDHISGSHQEIHNSEWSSPLLPKLGGNPLQLDLARVLKVLESIDVHVAFDVTARWVSRATSRQSPTREAVTIQPAESLQLLGRNLPNVYNELKNNGKVPWSETLELVRLGIGQDVADIQIKPDVSGGQISLAIQYRSLAEAIPMFWLSDGVISYLSFVALLQLSPPGGLLAFDEPEAHLHPGLIDRVVEFFERLSLRRPVLVATQSDRFLDSLTDPASSVVLCELDDSRATQLVRPDSRALETWLKEFRGIGAIRAAGHERSVLRR